MTVEFPERYPLEPPEVSMNSNVQHPNVFGSYICASILNTVEGYTPAYTLKGIAIQLLSFFGSNSVEQEYGGKVDLEYYRHQSKTMRSYGCDKCHFSRYTGGGATSQVSLADFITNPEFHELSVSSAPSQQPARIIPESAVIPRCSINRLPNEVLLQVAESLDFEDLTKFAGAWNRVSAMITEFDVIRTRELQCFVLKENYLKQMLGVGVAITGNGRQKNLQSEFDLVSWTARNKLNIDCSIHGIPFDHWLPLPISHGHWNRVQHLAETSLARIALNANIISPNIAIYAFMNDVMVRLNSDLERNEGSLGYESRKSTLRHASEKAIESYFHLFHLLLCFATSKPSIVAEANRMIRSFMSGSTSKTDVPNLGYLLIALLISDIEPTEALMKKIVTEAITRNVVWLLDRKGAGMAELAYLESDTISHYRLKKTFEGSRTSYRLLMFSELFRRTARPSPPKSRASTTPTRVPAVPKPLAVSFSAAAAATAQTTPVSPPRSRTPTRKTLVQLRDELFKRHGGPPSGTAARLASEVRRLQQINDFPSFLREMGITIPSASNFTAVLRDTVKASADKGYSRVTRANIRSLARLRLARDPTIDRAAVEADLARRNMEMPELAKVLADLNRGTMGFFPNSHHSGGGSRGQTTAGRGGSSTRGDVRRAIRGGRGRGRGF